jgi:hypothetical protein
VKDLTPTIGPHSRGIATRVQSTCRRDAHAIASPTRVVGVLRPHLEQVTAAPNRLGHFTEPLATSTQTATVLGARHPTFRTETFAEPPPITGASRR